MSIRRIQRTLRVRLRTVAYIIAFFFIIGLPMVFVRGRPGSPRGGPGDAQGPQQDVIAVVDGTPLSRGTVDRAFERSVGQMLPIYAQLGQSIGVERLWRIRLDSVEQVIARQLAVARAQEEGLTVSRKELTQEIDRIAEQQVTQLKGQYQGEELERIFARIAAQSEGSTRDRMSERSFRKWLKDTLRETSDELETDLLIEKLRQEVAAQTAVTEQDLRASYDMATVRELWVSLRPAGGPERTEEEALRRAEELAARAQAEEDFEALVRSESDSPDAEASGGLRERVRRGSMPEEWEAAVFSLGPDEVSSPIKLSGRYVIAKLEKLERELPEDFQEKKEELLKDFAQQKQQEAWFAFQTSLREQAQVEFTDAEMLAYMALREGNQEEALTKLEEASPRAREIGGITAGSIFYQKATLLAARNQWEEAAEAYIESHDALSQERAALPGARAEALMGIGRSRERMGQIEDAVVWYRAASDATESPSIHEHLLQTYQKLGKQELVEKEQQWLDAYREAEEERRRAMEEQQRAMEEQEEALPQPVAPSVEPEQGAAEQPARPERP